MKNDLRWATRVASSCGSGFGLILIFLGIFTFLGGNIMGGLWWVLIGLFLRGASQKSYEQLLIQRAFEGEPVSRFMKTDPLTVPRWLPLKEFVEEYIYKYHFKMFPVQEDGRLMNGNGAPWARSRGIAPGKTAYHRMRMPWRLCRS
jgi:hypothetical protein